MGNAIFNVFIKAITALMTPFFAPLQLLLQAFLPNLTDNITSMLSLVYSAIEYIAYPATILPKSFLYTLVVILTIEIGYLLVVMSYFIMTFLFRIIKRMVPLA